MDLGITSKVNENYLSNLYQKSNAVREADSTGFLSAISAKVAEKTVGMSFEEMLKSKYPGAYFNVMDTSKINRGLWRRNDYPWDAYFREPTDDAVLDWKPTGAEPDMQSPQVQSKINSMAGKMSIGIVWLAVPVFVMYMAKIINFDGTNVIQLFLVWMLAEFLNVIMQERIIHGRKST